MIKIYYLREEDLLLITIPETSYMDAGSQKRLRDKFKEETSIKNVMVIVGTFEVI